MHNSFDQKTHRRTGQPFAIQCIPLQVTEYVTPHSGGENLFCKTYVGNMINAECCQTV